jgi:hypothetical protein
MATRKAETAPLFTSGQQLDTAIGTAMATRAAKAAQASIGNGVDAAQPPSWRGKGGKGEETGGAADPYSAQASLGIGVDAAQPPSWRGKGGKALP